MNYRNAIDKMIHEYVAVKGCSCFNDLWDNEKQALVTEAVKTAFGNIKSVIKKYGLQNVMDCVRESTIEADLFQDIMLDLYLALEDAFDLIFDYWYLKEYGLLGIKTNDIGSQCCDPVQSDRKSLAYEWNYHNSMMRSLFGEQY